MELTLRIGGYQKASHHVVSRQMLQLTRMIPWFVGFLFLMFRNFIANSQPTPTDSEYLEFCFGASGVLGVSSFRGICCRWHGIIGPFQVPTRCPWKDIDRCSAWNPATSVPRSRHRSAGKGMRVKLGGVFKYVSSSFDIWGDDPILFDMFQIGLTPPTRKLIVFYPIQNFPPKNDSFFHDCMRIAVYVIRKKQFKMYVFL